jgi:hypothetical protein
MSKELSEEKGISLSLHSLTSKLNVSFNMADLMVMVDHLSLLSISPSCCKEKQLMEKPLKAQWLLYVPPALTFQSHNKHRSFP